MGNGRFYVYDTEYVLSDIEYGSESHGRRLQLFECLERRIPERAKRTGRISDPLVVPHAT